ncbi:CCR4-NOT transcription complex subunit 6-like [Saccoglossus kowalevskii]|uniref:poly(A)-specific ribonuclease n=1 Tax=Saccoglossus kowalevskii TaxID=10224 RepID=A0ABM0GJ18_SACKO|nr:PREDICTED: CCR4-NOT transcription complex subunit 6-like [Saccoglossus kowalevskii]
MPKEKYEPPNPRRAYKIMSAEEVASGKPSHWPELEINGIVKNLSPELWTLHHLTSLYLNGNNLSRIPPDISRLRNLMFLDLSSNKLRTLPAELGDMVNLRELLLNNNCLRVLPYELGRLFQLQTLGLKGNQLSSELMGLYSEPNGTSKLLLYMLDNLADPQSQPPQRQWIQFAAPDRTRPTAIFSVMCYNVLCDKYATRQIYGYCPSWALDWDYRRKGIMQEILQYGADIISLQEVETEQYYNFFLPELKQLGYDGVFTAKSRAKTMTEHERRFVDGCAIFFKVNKFSLVKEHIVEFNQVAMANAEGSEVMLNRVMTKDNIGIAAMLETKDGIFENSGPHCELPSARQLILVANVHIHWDPEYSDVKLIQTMMFMSELKTFIEESSHSFRPGAMTPDSNSIPLVFCGDLNSLPDSGVIEFLSQGAVDVNHADFKDIKYHSCLTNFSSNDHPSEFCHSFKLRRAYEGNIMSFTNYTYDFKGVIDYIFYSHQFMHPLGVLGPIDPRWFEETKLLGCPHIHVMSDHLALLTEFEMSFPMPGNNLIARR